MPDQRFLYTEEVVGANHPTKADTINRLALIDHNTDGTHKKPAFRVHKNGVAQTGIVSGTNTLLTWSTEEFDTNNNFATNRFTPTVPGVYSISLLAKVMALVSGVSFYCFIAKSGATPYAKGSPDVAVGTAGQNSFAHTEVYLNGTTDYIEAYIYQNTGSNQSIGGDSWETFFSGCRID